MTPMTRALLTNCTDTLSLCLGLTPATERWDGRPSQIPQTHHPPHPHPRSVDFVSRAMSCTDQRSALVADPLWTIPETRRSRGLTPVAYRPADPASRPVDLHAKQQKLGICEFYGSVQRIFALSDDLPCPSTNSPGKPVSRETKTR